MQVLLVSTAFLLFSFFFPCCFLLFFFYFGKTVKVLRGKNRKIFTDSMSVMSDTDRYRLHYPPSGGMLSRPYYIHDDYLEQEMQKFDQLARIHEHFQSKLALANVSNSATYQRENSSSVSTRDAPCKID